MPAGIRDRAAVAVPDLPSTTDFPRFAPAALASGLAAVFTFPLFHGDARFGALDLYSRGTGRPGRADDGNSSDVGRCGGGVPSERQVAR